MDEQDPFDPERFRLSPEIAAELARAKAEHDAGKRKSNKPEWLADKIAETGGRKPAPRRVRNQKRFIKFPGLWEETLAKARVSGATYAVAIVLVYEAWKLVSNGHKPGVKLTNIMLKRVYVGEKGKRAALAALERLKLVSVERRANRNPIVTVYFFE